MKSHHFECWVQKFENTLWVQLNIYVADSVLTVLTFVLDFGLLGVKWGVTQARTPSSDRVHHPQMALALVAGSGASGMMGPLGPPVCALPSLGFKPCT